MNSKIIVFSLIVCLLCTLTACLNNNEIKVIRDRGELRVGVKSDVPRFGYLNLNKGKLEGMEIDLARILAKDIFGNENAVKFIIVGSAQTRAAILENGEIDIAIATFTITEERKKNFNFSRSYFTDELGCLVRAGSTINKLEDLDGKIAGIARATTSKAAFEGECVRLGINVTVLEFVNYPEIKMALMNGKVDAFISDKSILYGYIDDMCVLLDDGFNPQQYGIASKKKNKKLAARIDALLGTLEKNGGLAELLKKWNLYQ